MLNSETIWKKVMTKKTRRRYTAEFKAAAVARLDEPGETLSSVAQALGVAATQVKTWRLEQQAAGSAEAVARRRAEASELQQLRRDNKRLQEENEILRKASAFFARWAEKAGKRSSPSSPPTCPPIRSACCARFWEWPAAGFRTGRPALRPDQRRAAPKPTSSARSGAFSRTAASAMALRASMPNCGPAAPASPASGSPGS